MDEKIREQLRVKKIQKMENPIIFMNPKDFEDFKSKIESTIQNHKVGENPKYEGIPIGTNFAIQQGTIVIYDNILHSRNRMNSIINQLASLNCEIGGQVQSLNDKGEITSMTISEVSICDKQ